MAVPEGLGAGGEALWLGLSDGDLDVGQLVILEQACRQRDRADLWAVQAAECGDVTAARQERDSQMAMARLIAALRLPDAAGRKPKARQLRGVQGPSNVSSLDRARSKAGA